MRKLKMLKLVLTMCVGLIMVGLFISSNTFKADTTSTVTNTGTGVPYRKYIISNDKNTALADGKDSVVISVGIFSLFDNTSTPGASPSNPLPACYFGADPAGTNPSNFLIKTSGSGNSYIESMTPINCASGYGSVTLTSTVAETKNITVEVPGKGANYVVDLSAQVVFTNPTPPPTTVYPTPTSSTAVPTKSSTTSVSNKTVTSNTKPIAPIVTSVNSDPLLNNQNVAKTILPNEPLVFSGTAVSNATIKLFIYSEPVTAETKSDVNGNWTYSLTNTLLPGEHRIEAIVTDATGNSSDQSVIANFIVQEVAASTVINASDPTPQKSGFDFVTVTNGLVAFLIILIGGLTFLIIRRRRREKVNFENNNVVNDFRPNIDK